MGRTKFLTPVKYEVFDEVGRTKFLAPVECETLDKEALDEGGCRGADTILCSDNNVKSFCYWIE